MGLEWALKFLPPILVTKEILVGSYITDEAFQHRQEPRVDLTLLQARPLGKRSVYGDSGLFLESAKKHFSNVFKVYTALTSISSNTLGKSFSAILKNRLTLS